MENLNKNKKNGLEVTIPLTDVKNWEIVTYLNGKKNGFCFWIVDGEIDNVGFYQNGKILSGNENPQNKDYANVIYKGLVDNYYQCDFFGRNFMQDNTRVLQDLNIVWID